MLDFTINLDEPAYTAGVVLLVFYIFWLVPLSVLIFKFIEWDWKIHDAELRTVALITGLTLIAAYFNNIALP